MDARGRALEHYEAHHAAHLLTLAELATIPSVSFPGYPAAEVRRSAEATALWLRAVGMRRVEILELPDAYPCVYGEWIEAGDAPTVLLYAHHDVQPPLRTELWQSPPFEPHKRDGRLYARGIADDKAGIAVHAASIDAWLQGAGKLPVNVKVLIEGEEEIGSPHLAQYLERYQGRLHSDVLVLTDCSNYETGRPSLTTSLRGLVTLEVTVSALRSPLHSGMWGGPLPDPVAGLCRILATLTDTEGRVAVPGVGDGVVPPTAEELADFRALGMTDAIFREQTGLQEGVEMFAHDEQLLVRLWREPSLVVNAFQAGLRGAAGNVLMDSAWARLGLRLVPDMDPERCARLLAEHIRRVCPWGLRVDIHSDPGAKPWKTRPDHPVFAVARRSLAHGYGRDAVTIGCGGTIPFVDHFTRVLGDIPALLVGIEDPYTNAHSENESLHLGDFDKAVRAQIHFFADLAAMNFPGKAGARA